jgi:hypothetical protein
VDAHLQLLDCLVEFESAVAATRDGVAVDFQNLFRRLDELARRLPPDTDPQLRHLLAQKSYQKARTWLVARRMA